MMQKTKSILTTQNLAIGYSQKKIGAIARGININLKKGHLISLIGENGIGKSTLLRTISGLQKAVSGNILLDGKKLDDYKPVDLAKNLSLVFTEKLPPGNLTVWELVATGRQPYTNWIGKLSSADRKIISEAMEMTQTAVFSEKRHYEISDGQMQKVMIARALAQDTPLIILDEPTTHLDIVHKISLLQLLKKLAHESNKCILFSTHDIELALEISDEMILMSAHSVVQQKPTEIISEKLFDDLFTNKQISFDSEKVKFVFKNF